MYKFQRFSFYGMRVILTLYLIHEHHMTDSTASLVFHAFIGIAYFSPLFGSIAADNYFGRFKVQYSTDESPIHKVNL